jgi:hypothetical protein
LSFWPKEFHKGKSVADTRDRGFSEELDDLLRCSEESLQQGPLAYFAIFLWVHNVHKLLGGSPKVLQLLLPPLLLLAQHLDLLKVVGELLFSVGDYLRSLSTSSVWRYNTFFMSVSNSSLYVKIFLSSAVKIFSKSRINC